MLLEPEDVDSPALLAWDLERTRRGIGRRPRAVLEPSPLSVAHKVVDELRAADPLTPEQREWWASVDMNRWIRRNLLWPHTGAKWLAQDGTFTEPAIPQEALDA